MGELVLADSDGSSWVSVSVADGSGERTVQQVMSCCPAPDPYWARAIQRDRWKGPGDPFLVAQQGGLAASISAENTLVYVNAMGGGVERLIFKNRQGQTVGELGQQQTNVQMPRLSPDEKSAVVRSPESGAPNIWIHMAGKKSRLTFEEDADWPTERPVHQFLLSP